MRKVTTFAALALLVAGLAACGASKSAEGREGEPIHLGPLRYDVQLSRFLNRADIEDSAYLRGQPAPPKGKDWFGVFLQIHNSSDEAISPSPDMEIKDTRGNTFRPTRSEGVFALGFGPIEAHSTVPLPDSPAASGPTEGAVVLFLLDESVSDNRPLKLEIPGPGFGQQGEIELDI